MKVLVLNFGTPSTIFFAWIKKIFLQTLVEMIFRYHKFKFHIWSVKRACEVHFWMHFWKIFSYTLSQSTFGTPSTKKFALIIRISLQPLDEIIVRYHYFFLEFWDPLGPPYKQQNEEKQNFQIWSVGYQNSIKRVCGVHFRRNLWKIFCVPPSHSTFGTPSTKKQFALIKKIFL